MRSFGKYRLVEPIASGGMADVWRAEVTGAEGVVKEVALKLVRGEHAARSDFVRMFVEEARLASRLGHANVVQLFEFDQVDGRYYIAMELVRGRHLGRVVERARELYNAVAAQGFVPYITNETWNIRGWGYNVNPGW